MSPCPASSSRTTGSACPQYGHSKSPYSTTVTGARSGPRTWSRPDSTGTTRSTSDSAVPSTARARRARALLGTAQSVVDLAEPVDPGRDHIRGPMDAPVTVVEYGDFECPYCGQAEPVVRELLADFGDVRYVWRHLPLTDVHPHAQLAAEASEVAGFQGAFWEMRDRLFEHQDRLTLKDLLAHAKALSLDVDASR